MNMKDTVLCVLYCAKKEDTQNNEEKAFKNKKKYTPYIWRLQILVIPKWKNLRMVT